MAARDLHTEELRARIVWLIRMRWIAAAGVAVVVWTAPRLVRVELPQAPLYFLTAGLALYNLALWGIARWLPETVSGPAVFWFANLQVSADLVFLTALLHFSGGIENPFICYYVFHIVIASILLPAAVAFLQVGFAVALIVGLALAESTGWLPHYHLFSLWPIELYRNQTYLTAVLFVMASMLYFTAMMAAAITARLRARESEIMQLSESLRDHTAELEQAYGTLHQLEREKSEYMHRAAHHLRSPLAASESMLAVVAEGRTGAVPAKAMEMIARTRERLHGMLDMAHDLLSLSQAQSATAEAPGQPVDLHRVLEAMAPDFQREAAAAGVTLRLTSAPDAVVLGLPDSLAELFENLVSNAVKYTPAGGTVAVGLTHREREVEVAVSDTGIGIPAEEQASIFEEFFRASNARASAKEGTGLGLSIVRAIATAHGADVSVESTVGTGTTFRVVFPRAEVAARQGAQA